MPVAQAPLALTCPSKPGWSSGAEGQSHWGLTVDLQGNGWPPRYEGTECQRQHHFSVSSCYDCNHCSLHGSLLRDCLLGRHHGICLCCYREHCSSSSVVCKHHPDISGTDVLERKSSSGCRQSLLLTMLSPYCVACLPLHPVVSAETADCARATADQSCAVAAAVQPLGPCAQIAADVVA